MRIIGKAEEEFKTPQSRGRETSALFRKLEIYSPSTLIKTSFSFSCLLQDLPLLLNRRGTLCRASSNTSRSCRHSGGEQQLFESSAASSLPTPGFLEPISPRGCVREHFPSPRCPGGAGDVSWPQHHWCWGGAAALGWRGWKRSQFLLFSAWISGTGVIKQLMKQGDLCEASALPKGAGQLLDAGPGIPLETEIPVSLGCALCAPGLGLCWHQAGASQHSQEQQLSVSSPEHEEVQCRTRRGWLWGGIVVPASLERTSNTTRLERERRRLQSHGLSGEPSALQLLLQKKAQKM